MQNKTAPTSLFIIAKEGMHFESILGLFEDVSRTLRQTFGKTGFQTKKARTKHEEFE